MKFFTFIYSACTVLLLASCATTPRPTLSYSPNTQMYTRTGRISLQVEQTPVPQSFIAGFELMGNEENGLLHLFSPVGNIVATAQWTATQAVLIQHGKEYIFPSLDALLHALTGAPLPASALFDWLNGRQAEAAGWSADLSQYQKGKIRAQRLLPPPAAKLQVVLQ